MSYKCGEWPFLFATTVSNAKILLDIADINLGSTLSTSLGLSINSQGKPPGVDFTNIFTRKSRKRKIMFTLLGSARAKAERKYVGESTPGLVLDVKNSRS